MIEVIDSYYKQYGENGHIEYKMENGKKYDDLKKRIIQFSFQLVRCDFSNIIELSTLFTILIQDVINYQDKSLLCVLFMLIGQCRDIHYGKGERDLSYMMITSFYYFYPKLTIKLLYRFVNNEDNNLPYGSWKDIKLLCNYINNTCFDENHPLIEECINIMNNQLREDDHKFIYGGKDISLCARWVPRESSKYKWLFKRLAENYFKQYLQTAKTEIQMKKAKTKAYMDYRILINILNDRLDTVQIKMCGQRWSTIDHNKTTSVTLAKNKLAFMNKGKKRGTIHNEDREKCAENFIHFIESKIKKGENLKGQCVGLVDYVKNSLEIIKNNISNFDIETKEIEIEILNSQFLDFLKKVGNLENMIAMVDQSGSMYSGNDHAGLAALGLGIVIANKSSLGKRVMTFSEEPSWISLENCCSFHECIKELQLHQSKSGFNTNFYRALKLILNACVDNKLDNSIVSNMVLVIFSDMQIDDGDDKTQPFPSMYDGIKKMYSNYGYTSLPHILFWNLRKTSGFPSCCTKTNTTMFSGYSPALLNTFISKGIDALKEVTPWSMLLESLNIPRYECLKKDFYDMLM
jgi:hypothetical protein